MNLNIPDELVPGVMNFLEDALADSCMVDEAENWLSRQVDEYRREHGYPDVGIYHVLPHETRAVGRKGGA